MTQHEYIFVTVSIIIGLAITRLLHLLGDLIRHHEKVQFHWSTVLWSLSILTFILQLWWIGWGLRDFSSWMFIHFLTLIFASICMYVAAEMALPDPDDGYFDMLEHGQQLGRFSAVAMLVYFSIGPYVNVVMLENAVMPSLLVPLLGVALMLFIIVIPRWFKWLSPLFYLYATVVLYLTV